MDAETLEAVAVVDIDPSQAAEWFDLVHGAHSASNGDWDTFSEQLRSAAGGSFDTAVETFLWYAADHGGIELVGKLVADMAALPSAYASSRQHAAEPQSQSWDTVVQQFGPGWAEWDGSEEGWMRFRDWTYSSANAENPELYGAAYEKLDPLGGLPLAERIARLTELGFSVQTSAAAAAPGEPSSDPIIEESLAEALREVPGAEALTPEQLEQMRAEIAEELASEAAQ